MNKHISKYISIEKAVLIIFCTICIFKGGYLLIHPESIDQFEVIYYNYLIASIQAIGWLLLAGVFAILISTLKTE